MPGASGHVPCPKMDRFELCYISKLTITFLVVGLVFLDLDLGQQKSSRKKNKKKNISENKQEPNSGVAKVINMFGEAPTRRHAAGTKKTIS